MSKDALSPEKLFEHVQDATYFHFPQFFDSFFPGSHKGHVPLPQPLAKPVLDAAGNPVMGHHGAVYEAVWAPHTGNQLVDTTIQPLDLVFTKFMAIELMVAIICVVLFTWLGMSLRSGKAPRGLLPNLLEVFLVFIRDQIARPAIGKHDADRYLPFLWTVFFFVLGCNLFGMLPWMGSPTGALAVTGVLALTTFGIVLTSGMQQMGVIGFLKAQVPHMDLPKPIAIVLVPMIFVIEIFGLLVKHGVLAIRLLANMMAGHIVLAVVIGFIAATSGQLVWWLVTPASLAGATALSLLELFVAFLQAYIFTFLSALFIGASLHAH